MQTFAIAECYLLGYLLMVNKLSASIGVGSILFDSLLGKVVIDKAEGFAL